MPGLCCLGVSEGIPIREELMSELSLPEGRQEGSRKHFETITAITLSFLAAVLAITDLGGGRYGDDEIIGSNEKANIYAWYQSKSVKQSVLESHRDLILTLVESGSIQEERVPALRAMARKYDEDVARYYKEKQELLLGSATVGKENWVQELDGQLGQVRGAKEWEKKLEALGKAGDRFDISVLFLQLSLVMGAISLVMQKERLKWIFYTILVLLGVVGIVFSILAYGIAFSLG